MPSRRDLIRMTDEEMRTFIEEKKSLQVATLGKDGAPEIFTRKRPLHADGRNEMYAGRWEGLGKPIEHGESLFNALQPEFSVTCLAVTLKTKIIRIKTFIL